MKRSILTIMTLAAASVLALTLTACSGGGTIEVPTVTEGQLTVATNTGYHPYTYYENDEFAGIDLAIAAEIAERMDLELVIEDIDFPEIFEGLQSGEYDLGAAAITITEERQENVNFSTPYASGRQAIIVSATSPIRNIYDMLDGDYTVGVKTGTTGDSFITADVGEARVVRYMHIEEAIDALVRGEIDAVVYDDQAADTFIAEQGSIVALQTPYAIEAYALAVPKSNPALLEQVNAVLAEMEADGTLQSIMDEYHASDAG